MRFKKENVWMMNLGIHRFIIQESQEGMKKGGEKKKKNDK